MRTSEPFTGNREYSRLWPSVQTRTIISRDLTHVVTWNLKTDARGADSVVLVKPRALNLLTDLTGALGGERLAGLLIPRDAALSSDSTLTERTQLVDRSPKASKWSVTLGATRIPRMEMGRRQFCFSV